MANDVKGILFDFSSTNKVAKFSTKEFVSHVKETKVWMVDHMSHHPDQQMYLKYRRNKNSSRRCHQCGRYVHIRPYYFKLYGYPQSYNQLRFNRKGGKNNQARKVWKSKDIVTCLIAHTSLRIFSREDLYFNSGCSRNMTWEKNYLKELKHYSNSYITFGDEARGKNQGHSQTGLSRSI